MPDAIYVDPNVTQASVIRVGGICYSRAGESNESPTIGPDDIEEQFNECNQCMYMEARSCNSVPPGQLSGIWMTLEDARSLSCVFFLASNCYYFGDDAPSNSHGTLYTAEEAECFDSCEDCPDCIDVNINCCMSVGATVKAEWSMIPDPTQVERYEEWAHDPHPDPRVAPAIANAFLLVSGSATAIFNGSTYFNSAIFENTSESGSYTQVVRFLIDSVGGAATLTVSLYDADSNLISEYNGYLNTVSGCCSANFIEGAGMFQRLDGFKDGLRLNYNSNFTLAPGSTCTASITRNKCCKKTDGTCGVGDGCDGGCQD